MSQGEGGGRPRQWETPEDLALAIDAYFTDAVANEQPLGILALCVHAGTSWETFTEYESGTYDTEEQKFSPLLKKARLKVMAYAESQVYAHTAGATFQLTNLSRKFKDPWKNAQHQEISLVDPIAGKLQKARERAKRAK